MAPNSKAEKAIAAELKKKNIAKAKDIVSQLKRDSQENMASSVKTTKSTVETVDSGNSNHETVKSNRESNVDVSKPVKRTYKKKTENKVEFKKQNTVKAKEIVSKLKRTSENASNVEGMASTVKTTKTMVKNMLESTATGESDSSSTTLMAETGLFDAIQQVATVPNNSMLQGRKPVQISASSSKVPMSVSSAANFTYKKSIALSKAGSSNRGTYQYEIDCKKVADSIDVIDLQRHLEKNLKVNGVKDNLGSTVIIRCQGDKVVITSKTFFPKKALRFLSKTFLKKNWNIQVVSKNVHSYEYKYVGTP